MSILENFLLPDHKTMYDSCRHFQEFTWLVKTCVDPRHVKSIPIRNQRVAENAIRSLKESTCALLVQTGRSEKK